MRDKSCFPVVVGIVALLLASTCSAATDYTYDGLNRLTYVDYGGGNSIAYVYDAAGNLTSVTTTAVVDSTPDPFSFAPQTNVRQARRSFQRRHHLRHQCRCPRCRHGRRIRLNSGPWTAAAGTVTAGQSVQVRADCSGAYGTASSAT